MNQNFAHTPEQAAAFKEQGLPYYINEGGDWVVVDPSKPVLSVVPTTSEGKSGWEDNYLADENKELKAELARLGGMTETQREEVIEQQAHSITSEVATRIRKKLDAPSFVNEEAMVELELLTMKTREEAKRRHRTLNTDADLSLFDGTLTLTEALQARYELPDWRVKGLLRVGHITTVAGMAKSGKTSLLVNRVKSFVDGNKLFGEYDMGVPVKGNVGVWNYELTPGQMVDWFKKADIKNTDKIRVLNARGAGLFIQNDLVLEKAIEWINRNEIEVLEIDPLQAAFVGSINDDKDAASYISALQRIQKESCVSDIILTTHMGHAAKNNVDAQRSIGSARWEGFPDNQWIFGREVGKPAKLRIDRGRDVFLEEISLEMDEESKILTKVFVPKPIDENWNAMLRMLKDGQPHEKRVVKEANGTASKDKSAIIAHIKWLKDYGLIEEFDMKALNKKPKDPEEAESYVPDYSPEGIHGQAVAFVQMNETGIRLLQEETEEVPIPDRLWFEGHNLAFLGS